MKRSQVLACISRWEGKGALYIVAHAKYQHYRGRNPSESYKGELNPRKALLLALAELRTFEPMCGSYIPASITEMVGIAKFTKQEVSGTFNDVTITASPTTSPEMLVTRWQEEVNRQAREYRNSAEYKSNLFRRAMQVQALRVKVQDMMQQLESLDFENIEAVVNWFDGIRDASDDVDVMSMIRREEIVQKFQVHGYQPNDNLGDKFNEKDKENVARYIVGQALDNLITFGSIHQVYSYFAEDWRKKFISPTTEAETIQ